MSNEAPAGYEEDGSRGANSAEYEKPKDEFLFFTTVFKTEEKKIVGHARFDQVTAQYWQLLRGMPEQDLTKNTISQKQYTELMRRIYKVLMPLYKDAEMVAEIGQEWILDKREQDEISQNILAKVLFRIAHWWCTNIDIDEYIDMLQRLYQRIIYKRAYLNDSESVQDHFPKIQVTFPLEEKRISETVVRGGATNQEGGVEGSDWLECRSNEANESDFEYKFEEDPEVMIIKKYKKKKAKKANDYGFMASVQLTISDPFVFNEEVLYPILNDLRHLEVPNKSVYDALLDMTQVLPFGYPTEQFLRVTKEDIHKRLEEQRQQQRAKAIDDTELHLEEKDPGLIGHEGGHFTEYPVDAWGVKPTPTGGVTITARCSDTLYNNYRRQLRDGINMVLRPYCAYPKSGGRSRGRSSTSKDEPSLELNKFGYNPALERRIAYKSLPIASKGGQHQYLNVNYLIADPDFETAYRSDVNRIENKGKMSIKDVDEIRREEEFNHVEATYRKIRQVMLQKKFEAIFRERTAADTAEQRRYEGIFEGVEKEKRQTMKVASLTQKGLKETFEEKSFVRVMRGPFSSLDSRLGLGEDDFYNCAEQDLIEAANAMELRVLVIGKPRSGKTTLAKNLSLKLDLVHVSVDNWLAALQAKVKAYEPPEDLEEGQEPPKFLSDLEESVFKALQSGSGPNDAQMVEIIKLQVHSPLAVLKGFVLDLSYYERENFSDQSWAGIIRTTQLLKDAAETKPNEFTHVIELFMDDDEVRLRAQHMRLDPADGAVYSRWEREERKKPKPKKEGEEEADPEDEENAIKPLDELSLVVRVNDTEERIRAELTYYNTIERPAIEELLVNFHEDQFIRLDAAGFTPDELTEAVQSRVKSEEALPLRPLPIQIEGAGDFKSLLTEGVEENHLPRKWSLWRQTDPVALLNGKVVQGAAEFACHYHGNVFVFGSEENLKAFMIEPKKYIQNKPQMPEIFRVLMLGAKGSGKHTQAQLLSQTYGWKIVDFKKIVKQKIVELLKQEVHIPNNPQLGGYIGLSEHELNDVIEGKPMPAWKFIPWLLDNLGYPLEKKKPPPPEEKPEGEAEEELDEDAKKKRDAELKKKAIEEEKKRKEEEEKERQKEERRQKRQQARDQGLDPRELGIEDSEEEVIPIEDLSIDQLVLKVDEVTGKAPFVGGFILVGFPENQEHIEKLKGHGIEFDRIIYLNDTNEEEPGAEIKKRMKDLELFDYDQENEAAQKVLALAKEHLGEETVKELSCNGTPETVFIRLRNEIDPFYLKVDNPEDVRVSADLGEEDKKLPKGDFGDYCPVTYVRDGWLVRGDPEKEITIYGKTYWPAGDEEAGKFKFNPIEFLKTKTGEAKLPLLPPNPKIMVLGHRGAGTTTLIRMICDKFKLEEFELKKNFLAKLKEEKEKRKRQRLLNRGFRPPPPAEEEGMEPPADPEIEDDPEDFDKKAHEVQVMKAIFDSSKGYVIDGTWRELPEGAIESSLTELLFESRRVPEIVVVLKCKEAATFDRVIDRTKVQAEFDRLMEERARKRTEEREAKRREKQEALRAEEEKTQEDKDAEMAKWEEDQDAEEEAAEEGDPDKPNLEAMLETQREALREARGADDGFFEEFSGALKEKQVFVVDDIKADNSADYILIKLLDRIKDNLTYRKDMLERQLVQPLKAEEVKFYEKSHIYKHSKFGTNSPLSLSNPAKTKKFTALYRERLYFLSNSDEQQKFLKEPSKYTQSVKTTPLDISFKPKAFVLGLPKSGKSTVCKMLVDKVGVIHLKMSKIIQYFITQDSLLGDQLRKYMKSEGRQLEDDMLVSLIVKRVQMKDCSSNGWVLEDFPKTRNQAIFLAKRGIVPTNVFLMRQSIEETYKRTHGTAETKFGSLRPILATRIKNFQENIPNLTSFYSRLYNSLIEIDSTKSKWFIEERALGEIQRNIAARQNFARDYFLRQEQSVCKMRDLHMDRCLVKQALSEFRFYCPVTWRNEKLLVKCNENTEDCVLYEDCFYFFKSTAERDLFIANPARFANASSFPRFLDLPMRFKPHKACEVVVHEKAISGYCSVTVMDEERVRKGDVALLVIYQEDKYVFDSEIKLQRFLANPQKYSKAQLPVKMPPPDDKVSLFNLQKMEDSISFMEQALGQVVTRGLREVSENRLKYPTLSLKETMLKLFALFLKTENPANTESMKRKYAAKMKQFIQRCELPEEIHDLSQEKEKKKPKGQWPVFKENYYNSKGGDFDAILKVIEQEKSGNFLNYIR